MKKNRFTHRIIISLLFLLGIIFFTTGPVLRIIDYPIAEITGITCLITLAVYSGIYTRINKK